MRNNNIADHFMPAIYFFLVLFVLCLIGKIL